ncbi:MAG: SUMF1/EgtB/PvdO family nonheme iron enzyme [Phycisphaerae bacterium]|nr:SUMF1/EgtB/PvdO family nonheme iron enzyme [Saprospiraceae bacterium]
MLPLDSLLHRLESAGFRVSPADRLRVVQLLDAMGSECLDHPNKLRLLLAPILARSAAEQAKFYEVFDQWMPKPEIKLGDDFKSSPNLTRPWLIAVCLVVLAALAIWYFTRPESTPTLPKEEITQNTTPDSTITAEKPTELPQEKPTEQEILKPQLPIKELLLAKEQETPRPSWLAWLLLALLTLGAGWMWWKWAKRAAPKPAEPTRSPVAAPSGAALGEIADAPPYTIPFRGQEAYIRTGREQYRLADAMRQRQQGEHPYMDVPASVQATLDKGGFPTLRFRLRRQPADYLCIIDEKHRQSHLTRLFKFFAEHIRGQDVALEIFQASGSLDRFWNAQYPGGLTLDQLQRLFPAHRLLLFGDAHALLDVAASGQARIRPDMGLAFRRWRQRVLFTPNAPATWTFEEKALYDLFAMFPATLLGMNDAAHHIEAGVGVSADDEAPPTFVRWRERAQHRAAFPQHDHRYTRWRDSVDHEEYLAGRPDLLLWLRALAVYPTPIWEITLAIGQSLEKQGVTVRPDDLLILSRIGWLQTGRMPSALREELMADLLPEAEKAARHAVITALEEARTEAGNGFAGIELGVNVAIQEFALEPNDPEKQEVMRLLFEAGRVNKAQELVADGALARYLARSKNSEVFKTSEVSVSARNFVKKEDGEISEDVPPKRPFFNSYFWSSVGITIMTIVFAFFLYIIYLYPVSWYSPEADNPEWLEKNLLFSWEVLPDTATIWNNRGVRAWKERRDTVTAMQWIGKAADLLKMDIPERLSDSNNVYAGAVTGWINSQKLRYNLAAELLNQRVDLLSFPQENDKYGSYIRDFTVKYFQSEIDSAITSLIKVDNSYGKLQLLPLQNDALHALGLTHLYCFRRDSAVACYERLIQRDSAYFTNLRAPNLETLLGMKQNSNNLLEFNAIEKNMIIVSGGTFTMGSEAGNTDETPSRSVVVGNFSIGKYEVTNAEYNQFCEKTGRAKARNQGSSSGRNPTVNVSWLDAVAYCNWLSESNSLSPCYIINGNKVSCNWSATGYRLPTEAEWEYAAKGGSKGRNKVHAGSDNLQEVGWFTENAAGKTHAIGQKKPNELGLFDMSGNAWEWCWDWKGNYDSNASINPKGPNSGGVRVFRGGSWADDVFYCRNTVRYSGTISHKSFSVGFRVVRSGAKEKAALEPTRASSLNQINQNMIPISGGTFTMGSNDKETELNECPHQVTLKSFRLNKYEVTQAQWRAVMGADPPELYNKGCYDCPVDGVSWNDVQEFLKKLNELTGSRYRLPSEAEWEYAAKGGQSGIKFSYKYAGSDNLNDVAWYSDNYKEGNIFGEQKTTRPVGGKKPNQLGVYDMSGNVWEWCQDIYQDYPCDKAKRGNGFARCLRGGAWSKIHRSSERNSGAPAYRYNDFGFRLAQD